MPELPDIELYLHGLRPRLQGRRIERIRVASPFFVRSVDPPIEAIEGRSVLGFSRLGKRIVFAMDGGIYVVLHLMIAGRLRWLEPGATIPFRIGLAAFDATGGSLIVTEAGARRRASLQVVAGDEALAALDPGGLEVLDAPFEAFARAVTAENHTLKRALTDPHLLSGIGNAYSDEILHAAQLSPLMLTSRLDDEQLRRLHKTTVEVLTAWRNRLIRETGDTFPTKVTAFRPGMAVHGRYGQPCPICATPVQRIRYAANEANYCPACQTGGKLLADRSLSRLLREDWPKSLEELEQYKKERRR